MAKRPLPYFHQKLTAESKIHGGKHYLCRRILQEAPEDFRLHPERWGYQDGYMGAGSMTYNAPAGIKRQLCTETSWFRYITKVVIRDRLEELLKVLSPLTYAENEFETARRDLEIDASALRANLLMKHLVDVKVRCAANYIISNRMSRGGLGKAFAWSDRLRGGQPGDRNAWCTMIRRLLALSSRLKNKVEILHMPSMECFDMIELESKRVDMPWFCYWDPTYPKETRSTNAVEYGEDEMSPKQHEEMLSRALTAPPLVKIAISSYHNKMYDEMLKGWRVIEIDMPNHSSQSETKERRTECLYLNY